MCKQYFLFCHQGLHFPSLAISTRLCKQFLPPCSNRPLQYTGTLFSFSSLHWPALAPYLPVLLVGFLGAFTTFSTFALETARFLADGAYGRATLNFLLQNGIGITAAAAGLATGRLFS